MAAQAARIAGQHLDADRFLDTAGSFRLSTSAARHAALDYIEHVGMTGDGDDQRNRHHRHQPPRNTPR